MTLLPGKINRDAVQDAQIRDLIRQTRRIPSRWAASASGPKQAWVFDGNTVFSGESDIFGVKKYTGASIAEETPAALPEYGTLEAEGDYVSGVDGIGRAYLRTNADGHKVFILIYSPSIPYWLISGQTVTLGNPTSVGGLQVFPIVWGVS